MQKRIKAKVKIRTTISVDIDWFPGWNEESDPFIEAAREQLDDLDDGDFEIEECEVYDAEEEREDD